MSVLTNEQIVRMRRFSGLAESEIQEQIRKTTWPGLSCSQTEMMRRAGDSEETIDKWAQMCKGDFERRAISAWNSQRYLRALEHRGELDLAFKKLFEVYDADLLYASSTLDIENIYKKFLDFHNPRSGWTLPPLLWVSLSSKDEFEGKVTLDLSTDRLSDEGEWAITKMKNVFPDDKYLCQTYFESDNGTPEKYENLIQDCPKYRKLYEETGYVSPVWWFLMNYMSGQLFTVTMAREHWAEFHRNLMTKTENPVKSLLRMDQADFYQLVKGEMALHTDFARLRF